MKDIVVRREGVYKLIIQQQAWRLPFESLVDLRTWIYIKEEGKILSGGMW